MSAPLPDLPATASFPRGIRVVSLPCGSEVVRIHRSKNGPIWFGPRDIEHPQNRFDSPDGRYRILYAAKTLEGAFVEAILHNRPGLRFLTRAYLADYAFTPITVKRDLRLAKLYGDGLIFHGVDAQISTSADYTEPRRLAETLFNEVPTLNGIAYRSRHNDGEFSYAVFDRGITPGDLEKGRTTRFKNDSVALAEIIQRYGLRIDPENPLPPLSPGRGP